MGRFVGGSPEPDAPCHGLCHASRSVRACGHEQPGQVSCLRHPGTNPGAAACDADMRPGIGNRLACPSLNPPPLIPIPQTNCWMGGDDECRDSIRAPPLPLPPLHHWPAAAHSATPYSHSCNVARLPAAVQESSI